MRAFLLALIGMCAACDMPVITIPASAREPGEDQRVEIMARPSWLAAVEDSLIRCSGRSLRVPIERVRFFLVFGNVIDQQPNDGIVAGVAYLESAHIYLERYSVQYPRVWMHELAHVLLQVRGHPDDVFARCGLVGLGPGDPTLTPLIYLLDTLTQPQ